MSLRRQIAASIRTRFTYTLGALKIKSIKKNSLITQTFNITSSKLILLRHATNFIKRKSHDRILNNIVHRRNEIYIPRRHHSRITVNKSLRSRIIGRARLLCVYCLRCCIDRSGAIRYIYRCGPIARSPAGRQQQ